MTLSDELARLQQLRDSGSLSETEFEAAKQRVIHEHSAGSGHPVGGAAVVPGQIHGISENMYCTLMHLSQLLTYSVLGIIAPILMWVISKDQSEMARRHGAAMMNWFLSSLIYYVVGGILTVFLIGIPILIVVGILSIVFPIIAAIKAIDGKHWSYPLSIQFFDEN
ncbi:MAG: DUF4870 domain-containing protein [Planctomycetota bacterium]